MECVICGLLIVLIHFFWPVKIERETCFPVLIRTEDGEVKVCERPEDLPTGRGFRVVATNREILI